MNYHSQEAFEDRLRTRRAVHSNGAFFRPKVFYHVACLGDWKNVVAEQTRLLRHFGFTKVTAGVLGQPLDIDGVRSIASVNGIELTIGFSDTELTRYEEPTLSMLHAASKTNHESSYLYLHTKGVSAPGDEFKVQWRRVMQKEVVAAWKRNAKLLEVADVVGVDWRTDPHFPHFCGNFWTARGDWLANLPLIEEYKMSRRGWGVEGQNRRLACETWIGSRPYHHIESILGYNANLWIRAGDYSSDIPGFTY